MMKPIKFAVILMLSSSALAQAPIPKEGFVPTAKEAIEIGQVVLEGMKGKPVLEAQGGMCAFLHGKTWEVTGKCFMNPRPSDLHDIFIMHIDKITGAILDYNFKP